jgi:F-type H+-transporting ATPase subunit b
MNRIKYCVIAVAPLLWSSAAFAEEGHGGGATNPFAGDIGNALWTVVIFVVVLVVLGKFAWGPILGALQKREDFIRESLEKAKSDREDAQRVLKEYSDRINSARAEASAIVDEGRRDAEVVKRQIEEHAKQEAQAMLDRAKREIGIARDTAVGPIRSHQTGYRHGGRIVAELNEKEHERLISESIDEIVQAVPTQSGMACSFCGTAAKM